MHELLADLFPLRRSLTGNGVRETLRILQERIPLTIHEIPSGTAVSDWTIPPEWNLRRASLFTGRGELIFDTELGDPSLHVVGYSRAVNAWMSWDDLAPHVHTLPEQPDATPYVTAYYADPPAWGVCIPYERFRELEEQRARCHVLIDATHDPSGSLTYADMVIPGETDREMLLSSYICHNEMANNELSGPVVLTYLAEWLMGRKNRLTYRIVLAPETIGAIAYLCRPGMLDHLRKHVDRGYVLTCMGGPGGFQYQDGPDVPELDVGVLCSPWKDRASDERQWCAPGVGLPVTAVRKTPPGDPLFPQYHTSLDNLDYVTEEQLRESLAFMKRIISIEERWVKRYRSRVIGEPMLSKRSLYPDVSKVGSSRASRELLDVWSFCDGRDQISIAAASGVDLPVVTRHLQTLLREGIIEEVR